MSKLSRSFLILAVFFGLEKLLGFARYIAIANQFGFKAESDAFYVANNLPDLILALISGGALAVAFIPVLAEFLEKGGRPRLWELFSRVANLVFVVSAVLSLLIAIFALPLVRTWIAPGFSPDQQELAANLMRMNLLATLLLSVGGLIIAGLQANKHFLLPALAPVMYDLGALFGVFILAPSTGYQIGPLTLPSFGMGIYGPMTGYVIGAALFVLVQVPGLLRYQFRWMPAFNLRDPGLLKVLSMMGPRVLTASFIYLIFIAQENIASRLATGSVSFINYGWLFMQVPETLIGTAIATALLPTISELFARGDQEAFGQTINSSLRVILALTIPIAALIAVAIPPIVGFLGGTAAEQGAIVWTTRAFLVGLAGHALLEVASRSFYARQKPLIPLLASALTLVVFVPLAFGLAKLLEAAGIALANSLAFTAEAALLWILLNRAYPEILKTRGALGRALLAAALAAVLAALLLLLPFNAVILAVAAMGLGVLAALPFIWREIKLLIHL